MFPETACQWSYVQQSIVGIFHHGKPSPCSGVTAAHIDAWPLSAMLGSKGSMAREVVRVKLRIDKK